METFISQNFIFSSKCNAEQGSCGGGINSGESSFGIGDESGTIGNKCTIFDPAVDELKCKEFVFIAVNTQNIFKNNDGFINMLLNIGNGCGVFENTEALAISENFTTVVSTIEPSTATCWSSKYCYDLAEFWENSKFLFFSLNCHF